MKYIIVSIITFDVIVLGIAWLGVVAFLVMLFGMLRK